jgi:hypothetical protein
MMHDSATGKIKYSDSLYIEGLKKNKDFSNNPAAGLLKKFDNVEQVFLQSKFKVAFV